MTAFPSDLTLNLASNSFKMVSSFFSLSFTLSTSIDYLDGVEERESMLKYNNTSYIAITTAKYYYCLLNFNITSGSVIKSQWAYVYHLESAMTKTVGSTTISYAACWYSSLVFINSIAQKKHIYLIK